MVQKLVVAALVCFASAVAAQTYPTYPPHLYPVEHRTAYKPVGPIEGLPSMNGYNLQIVPISAVAEYESSTELSIWDYIPDPSTALSCIASKALAVTTWTLSKAPLIILGIASVVGFCAFTPYCTLVIEKPLTRGFRSLNIPFLDDVEYYFRQAYNKYHDMQKHH